MTLAAFDLSLACTGFAVGGAGKLPRTGSWPLPRGRWQLIRAMSMLRQNIMSLLRFEKCTHVYIEAPMHVIDKEHSADAAYVLICLSAIAQEVSGANGCQVKLAASSTWRKTIFGTPYLGGTSEAKTAALARVARIGIAVDSHDAAEAALLWVHGMLETDRNWQPPKGALGAA